MLRRSTFRQVMLFVCPPRERWNQNRHNTFFMACLGLTLVLIMTPLLLLLRVSMSVLPSCRLRSAAGNPRLTEFLFDPPGQTYKSNCGPYGAPEFLSPFS